jgi:hypothetical protein
MQTTMFSEEAEIVNPACKPFLWRKLIRAVSSLDQRLLLAEESCLPSQIESLLGAQKLTPGKCIDIA